MGIRKKTEWSEYKIQQCLRKFFLSESAKRYELCNLYVYDWESDYLAITRSGIAYECEIKISKQDFVNDSKKHNKHVIISEGRLPEGRPNYFYYAVPEGLITTDEVPEHAGLIYVMPYGIQYVKEAKKVHEGKFDFEKTKLMDKLYYNYIHYRDLYKESDVSELKKTINSLKKQMFWYDEELSKVNMDNDWMKLLLKKHNIDYE
jgi:hypothetical protein